MGKIDVKMNYSIFSEQADSLRVKASFQEPQGKRESLRGSTQLLETGTCGHPDGVKMPLSAITH